MRPAPPTKAQLGTAVRRLRTEAGLSIEALAAAAGMHPTYLSGIERGNYNPSWTKLVGLAEGLRLPVSAIAAAAEQEATGQHQVVTPATH
jgi:transcriptional regulator with XRE-family HTH domain